VVAGRGDRVVADGVAAVPGVQPEDSLDPALAAAATDGLGECRDDRLEGQRRLRAGLAHLVSLEVVLGQPELAQGDAQGLVGLLPGLGQLLGALLGLLVLGAADLLDQGGDGRVRVPHDPDPGVRGILGQLGLQVADGRAADPAEVAQLVQ
jgi:hypothetical protein